MKRSMVFGVAMVFVMFMYAATIFALSEHTFSGKIMMVDPKLKIMVVKDNKNDEMTFRVQKQTEILIAGEPKLLGELHKGEDVTITYATSGDQHVAKNAKVTPSSPQS